MTMKNQGLTIEKLRELTGINYNDEKAWEIVFAIKQLVSIIMDYQQEQEEKSRIKRVENVR